MTTMPSKKRKRLTKRILKNAMARKIQRFWRNEYQKKCRSARLIQRKFIEYGYVLL